MGSTAAVVAIYYLLPLDHSSAGFNITALLVGLVALIVLVTLQIRWIVASRWSALRALEALGISVPFFLLLFASTYVVMAALSASNFSAPMTHTNGLYFSVILGAVTRGRERRTGSF